MGASPTIIDRGGFPVDQEVVLSVDDKGGHIILAMFDIDTDAALIAVLTTMY